MQFISTRYVAPTNTRGARVKATASGGRVVTLSWDYELGQEGNHDAAALVKQLDWPGRWVRGEGDAGNVYVNANRSDAFEHPSPFDPLAKTHLGALIVGATAYADDLASGLADGTYSDRADLDAVGAALEYTSPTWSPSVSDNRPARAGRL